MSEWWDGFISGAFAALTPSLIVLAYMLLGAPTIDDD